MDCIIKTHIPHKTAKTKESLPWITRDIKKLIKKKDRLYKQKKKSGDKQIEDKYKVAKRSAQRELRILE